MTWWEWLLVGGAFLVGFGLLWLVLTWADAWKR